jgi:hypothetical protein
MVKIDNLNNQPPTNQTENCGFDNFETQKSTSAHQNNNQSQTQKPSGLLTIIGQLLPLAPFAFEQFTGQKVPQMTGTIAEMQMSLIQIGTSLQTIANNQQSLNQRLIQLETNATNHLTNLTNQFKSLRLTHTKEQKQIEYNHPPLEENQNQEY